MKPILFNTEMVRAILDGRKTVTRRVVKPQPILYGVLEPCWNWHGIKAPYEVGDILYVRETWYYESHMEDVVTVKPDLLSGRYSDRYIFKADCPEYPVNVGAGQHGWRPSIHMPREAARIFLRVKNVRVERLQDIRRDEAVREGASPACAVGNFKAIWDSTIPKHPNKFKRYPYYWNDNPWVWVIEFERISKDCLDKKEDNNGLNH